MTPAYTILLSINITILPEYSFHHYYFPSRSHVFPLQHMSGPRILLLSHWHSSLPLYSPQSCSGLDLFQRSGILNVPPGHQDLAVVPGSPGL